jgi:AcrR family transcriptional regulator
MPSLPKNVRWGRKGRIGILKRVPRDLWEHPHYRDKAKIIERSTGVSDEETGVVIAKTMLDELERQFDQHRAELASETPQVLPEVFAGKDNPIVRAPDEMSGAPAENKNNDKKDTSKKGKAKSLSQAGEQTRRDIIAAAMIEFSKRGLRGARVDNIAAQTRTTKPMIYYYFGSKEKLYAAVMVEAYGGMRDLEKRLHLRDLQPEEAMRRLVEATFDHHAAHPEYVRLVTAENMEYARHIEKIPSLKERNAVAIEMVKEVLERGESAGVFRPGINPWHLHLLINSFCFMRVSNRYTWRAIFGLDLWAPEEAIPQRQMIVESVLRYCR